MANTYDFTVAAEGGQSEPWDRSQNLFCLKRRIDFGDEDIFTAALASTDTYNLFDIPAGTYVLAAWFDVIEAEATNTTATLALGDSSATAGYLTAVAPIVVGTYAELYNGSAAYCVKGGRFYGSAQADSNSAAERLISAIAGTAALSNAVIDFYVLCYKMTG